MATRLPIGLMCLFAFLGATAQTVPADGVSIVPSELPAALLWQPYRVTLHAAGGTEPYRWRLSAGELPRGWTLRSNGELDGSLEQLQPFQFTAVVVDSSTPPVEKRHPFTLNVEIPLRAVWERKARVNGQRIDGSVRVSNGTGRDFDLTVIILAVNDLGRATAIGYQHFKLKKNTVDMEIPFGDSLSPGNYAVNVDVVGEEPVSKKIFRARLVTSKQAITQGP